ncbi:hypothetical protein G6F68_010714 [Rhizopus microsporus]|nr:hypothetical protein G6F68_010714 [Rhizopus microsporus]
MTGAEKSRSSEGTGRRVTGSAVVAQGQGAAVAAQQAEAGEQEHQAVGHATGAQVHAARIAHQAFDVLFGVARHAFEVEIVEGLAKGLALAQDGDPGHARLKPFQADLFVQATVIGYRPPPFMVVIVGHGRLPKAARRALRIQDQAALAGGVRDIRQGPQFLRACLRQLVQALAQDHRIGAATGGAARRKSAFRITEKQPRFLCRLQLGQRRLIVFQACGLIGAQVQIGLRTGIAAFDQLRLRLWLRLRVRAGREDKRGRQGRHDTHKRSSG